MWRYKVITASNHIFPGLVYHDRDKQFYDAGNLVKSNLLLQMVLYFNVWLFPIWLFIIILGLDAKYYNLTDVYKFLSITIFLLFSIFECIKLYLGYIGNLAEKIPELASFWMLSTLVQFPLMLFMILEGHMLSFLVEKVSTGMMIFLLVIEIVSSTITLNNIAAHHLKRFYMAQVCGVENHFNNQIN